MTIIISDETSFDHETKMPAHNTRFCEIGGWSDSPKCGRCENRRWKSKRRAVASPTSQSRRDVSRHAVVCPRKVGESAKHVILPNGIIHRTDKEKIENTLRGTKLQH